MAEHEQRSLRTRRGEVVGRCLTEKGKRIRQMKTDRSGFEESISNDRCDKGFNVLLLAHSSDVDGEPRIKRQRQKARNQGQSVGPSVCGTGDFGTAAFVTFARFAVPPFQPRMTRRLRRDASLLCFTRPTRASAFPCVQWFLPSVFRFSGLGSGPASLRQPAASA